MEFPPKLLFDDLRTQFELEVNFVKRDEGQIAPGMERISHLKDLTIGNIKRLSHTGKKKDEIRTWVNENFPAPEEMVTFVQGIPIVVIAFIARGVTEFGK
jgi:hypothetical protein